MVDRGYALSVCHQIFISVLILSYRLLLNTDVNGQTLVVAQSSGSLCPVVQNLDDILSFVCTLNRCITPGLSAAGYYSLSIN